MTDHIKTVTLTPVEQMREAAAQLAKSRCDKCGGEGWLWGHELKDYEHPYPGQQDDTKYSCDGDECMTSAAIRALPLPPEPTVKPLTEEEFLGAVWEALKADASDLSKQARILAAFRAALPAAPKGEKHDYQ